MLKIECIVIDIDISLIRSLFFQSSVACSDDVQCLNWYWTIIFRIGALANVSLQLTFWPFSQHLKPTSLYLVWSSKSTIEYLTMTKCIMQFSIKKCWILAHPHPPPASNRKQSIMSWSMILLFGFNLIFVLERNRLRRCYESKMSEWNCYFDTIWGVEEAYGGGVRFMKDDFDI